MNGEFVSLDGQAETFVFAHVGEHARAIADDELLLTVEFRWSEHGAAWTATDVHFEFVDVELRCLLLIVRC